MMTGKRQLLRSESKSEEIFDPPTITVLDLGEQLFLDDQVTVNAQKFREICSLVGLQNLATMAEIIVAELKEQLKAKL